MLNQGLYELYPADNIMFRVIPLLPGVPFLFSGCGKRKHRAVMLVRLQTIVRLELPSNFLVPYAFTCWVLICF